MDIVIVAQPYCHWSNGTKAIHKICHTINTLGGNAKMAFHQDDINDCQYIINPKSEYVNPAWNTPIFDRKEVPEDCFVLYPEVVLGNPLNAKKVIRFFGNKEGAFTNKKIQYGKSDFSVAHSKIVKPDADYVLFYADVNPCFNDDNTEPFYKRTLDATYIGKGYLYGKCEHIKGTVEIGRKIPNSQEGLAEILKSVRFFHTWDSMTQTNVEAVLCGAVPVFRRYDPWTKEEIDSVEIGYIPRLDFTTEIDYKTFKIHQLALKEKVLELTNSWDERVLGFVHAVELHFEESM